MRGKWMSKEENEINIYKSCCIFFFLHCTNLITSLKFTRMLGYIHFQESSSDVCTESHFIRHTTLVSETKLFLCAARISLRTELVSVSS